MLMWGKPDIPLFLNCESCRWEYEVHHGHRFRLVMCSACSFVADLPCSVQDHYLTYLEQERHSDEKEVADAM